MPARSIDIDAKAIKTCVAAIRQAVTTKEATRIFIAFCERYRKNYTARRKRLKYYPLKEAAACRKWYEANKKELSERRAAAYKKKAEEEWQNGLRKWKPRHMK